MNRFSRLLLFSLILVGVHSAMAAEVQDTTVCSVLASPSSFDGKVVRLKSATAIAGFDVFLVDGSDCRPAGGIWLAYPEGTKAKAGPAAFLRLQLAKNSGVDVQVPSRGPMMLQTDSEFAKFDALLATRYSSPALCLGCPRYAVSATLVGRIDGVTVAGLTRDSGGKPIGLAGFGNMNLYRARLVLQSVTDVTPHDVNYKAGGPGSEGDSRRVGPPASADQAKRGAAAFGEPGEHNGVEVGVGVANEVPLDEGARGSQESPDGILFLVTFDMARLGRPELSKAIAHVGTHIADIRSGHLEGGLDEAEARAWRATFSK